MKSLYIHLIQKITSIVFVISLLSSGSLSLAQTPKGGRTAANKPAAPAQCSVAWTGSVRYSRKQSMSDNKRVERVSGRGFDVRDWQMKYDYNAQVSVIESPGRNGSSEGRATINH